MRGRSSGPGGMLWPHTCFYNGVRVTPKSISSGEATQQPSNSKPSTVPFFKLLAVSDGDATPIPAVDASGSRSQAQPDTSVSKRTGSQEKKSQATPDQTPSEATATTTTQLVDVTACLPIVRVTSAPASMNEKFGVAGDAPTTSGSSVGEILNSKNSDPAPTVPISQLPSPVAQSSATQQRDLTSALPTKPTSEGTKQPTDGVNQGASRIAEPTNGKAKTDAQPDCAQESNSGTGSTLQIPDIRVASEISIAMESILTNPQALSNDLIQEQNTNKMGEGTNPGSASSANSDVSATKTQARVDSVEPVRAPLHGAQSSQVSTQHNPSDVAQSSAATAKTSDTVALPADFAIPRPPAHETPSSAGISSDTGTGNHRTADGGSLSQNHFDGAETAGVTGVNTARVIQTMSESEMRVGMRSVEFGDISIHTSISQQQLVAQITVDHRDLGNAISSHISMAQAKLGNDYGIHASIEINQSGASLSGERQNSQQQAQRQSARSPHSPNGSGETDYKQAAPTPLTALNDAYRLDIRA